MSFMIYQRKIMVTGQYNARAMYSLVLADFPLHEIHIRLDLQIDMSRRLLLRHNLVLQPIVNGWDFVSCVTILQSEVK